MLDEATYFDLYQRGEVLPDEIYDFIEVWREKFKTAEDSEIIPLHAFLGLSHEEYEIWVHEEESLKIFVQARKTGVSPANLICDPSLSAAARTDNSQLQQLHQWLAAKYGK